jgi:alpha-D-xyloside xylohydrolase
MAEGAAPWDAGEPALAVFRAYAELRYRLLPYLLHCARETADLGLPMLRPLVLEFSWDATAAQIDDQYLLGRDLLVAPVFSDEQGPVERRVYLPAYANWYDWWTGVFLEGGQWVEQSVPLERLPLYVRAGTAVPLADPRPAIGDQPIDVTRLLLFAPRDGAIGSSVELADGDMLGVEHERGPERSRIYIEGLPPTVRDIEIVGLPGGVEIVDAASTRVRIVPGDGLLPGFGGTWDSVTIALDVGAYTTGLELRW